MTALAVYDRSRIAVEIDLKSVLIVASKRVPGIKVVPNVDEMPTISDPEILYSSEIIHRKYLSSFPSYFRSLIPFPRVGIEPVSFSVGGARGTVVNCESRAILIDRLLATLHATVYGRFGFKKSRPLFARRRLFARVTRVANPSSSRTLASLFPSNLFNPLCHGFYLRFDIFFSLLPFPLPCSAFARNTFLFLPYHRSRFHTSIYLYVHNCLTTYLNYAHLSIYASIRLRTLPIYAAVQ